MKRLLTVLIIFLMVNTLESARPIYTVKEFPEVRVASINKETQRISVELIDGGSQSLSIGPKTWLIKDNEEASFSDLKVGQNVRVHFIPRGSQAVAVEILSSK